MKIILAGDSTVAACPSYEYPMSGWGPALPPFVYRWAAVHNLAKGGASTESFREEGLWDAALALAGAGDAVVLQFGHNDQKREHLAPRAGYAANLRRMVGEVRGRSAGPVLCTPVERRQFAGGRPEPTLGEYPAAVRELGAELGVGVIDLNAWTRSLYGELGEDGSVRLFTHLARGEHHHWADGLEDNTHFSVEGAERVARHVAERLAPLVREPEAARG
ncbi:rhamnogalacturonan acetylesterase [Sinomonas sp. G460-2]|uniref:rhamnogalacturonan acetylesterase n=1 Tax=Sinomonas sp. G460-2 TaxID=3393464 RepID=UPI0039EEB7D0